MTRFAFDRRRFFSLLRYMICVADGSLYVLNDNMAQKHAGRLESFIVISTLCVCCASPAACCWCRVPAACF